MMKGQFVFLLCTYLILLGHAGDNRKPLSWDLRVDIALDIARGLEYLHYGVCFHFSFQVNRTDLELPAYSAPFSLWQAVPSVVHRDIKSSNILLDRSMRARVCDPFFSFFIVNKVGIKTHERPSCKSSILISLQRTCC